MTAWLWVLGAVVILAVVTLPYLRAHPRPSTDRARSLLSRLEHELDRSDITEAARAEAERCRTLAGSALADDAAARAERWAGAGLRAVGVTAPKRPR
ncbi:hypothetical protein ACOBQX_14600 [Actinokineospora sp. G85]|uniref:hypothetical protein n=1 Tax=Actinokineospora sp. G85 TaxID=3406626 RepID=UPI003C7137B5